MKMRTLKDLLRPIHWIGVIMLAYTIGAFIAADRADAASVHERAAEAERQAAFIEDIQEALYTLGYIGIDDVDGSVGPKTAMAIRRFEGDHGLVRSGKPTDELRQLLIDMAFPDLPADPELVGAVSVGRDLKWGASYGRYTREVAMATAVRRCERNSRSSDICAQFVSVAVGYEWMAVVICGRRFTSDVGKNAAEAERAAIDYNRSLGGRSSCSRVLTVNATFGQYIDDDEQQLLSQPSVSIVPPLPSGAKRTDI